MNTDGRITPYPLRLEPETRAKLETLAKANGRSLNAQIAMMLEGLLQSEENPIVSNGLEEHMRQIAKEVFTEMQAQKPNKKKPG